MERKAAQQKYIYEELKQGLPVLLKPPQGNKVIFHKEIHLEKMYFLLFMYFSMLFQNLKLISGGRT